MNDGDLVALLTRLRAEPHEAEWLEFKANRFEPQELGEYISALANAACLQGRPLAYLVFGVEDATHEICGTSFSPHTKKAKGNQDLLVWLATQLEPNPGFEVHRFAVDGKPIVMFEIGPGTDRPVLFAGRAFIRDGSVKTLLANYAEKERAIWARRVDWSALVCERASIADLDPDAIREARQQYRVKHPARAADVQTWDDTTFLNKAKLTVRGAITNAAIVLLGREEAAALVSPAVAKLTWVLRDDRGTEVDYAHHGPPFLLAVGKVLGRIRNLTVRALPSGSLFPTELSQYDDWVIREALHNCIAHQDYGLRGRINVVETPGNLTLTNLGSFLPGSVEAVIEQDAPPEAYRNPFLDDAMVNLNMIDTQGGGIKRMFLKQKARSFPMPDYDLSDPSRVVVTIAGRILDERYTRLLMERTDLDLRTVMMLDKVQKRTPLSREEHHRLKVQRLVEGRFPNLIVSERVAKAVGDKARHVRDRGLDDRYYLDLICELIKRHGPVDRKEIDGLLVDKLPEILSDDQKAHKIHNLLGRLSRQGVIVNHGTRHVPRWQMAPTRNKGTNG